MGKRKIKLLMLGLMDRIEQINAILVEKNKYKNKKRISIYNSVNLTKEQVNDTESLYTENYGKKIPLIWHRSYTAYTGNFAAYNKYRKSRLPPDPAVSKWR